LAQTVFDWLVVGGGSAGLSVAKRATDAGHSVCVVDKSNSLDFASVRNQGWLHSGGLFCYYRDGESDVAAECQNAKALIEQIQSQSGMKLIDPTPGVALFKNEYQAHRWVDRSLQNGIDARLLDPGACDDLFARYGRSDYHNFAVELQDCAVDNAGFLNALSQLCVKSGVVFGIEPYLFDLGALTQPSSKDYWSLEVSGNQYRGTNAVICLGVLGPAFLEKNLGTRIRHRVTNSYVMAIDGLKVDRLIISPNPETKSLNISPYSTGTTVNCGSLDQHSEVDRESAVDLSREVETIQHLSYNWPKISGARPTYSSYVCQKLEVTEADISVEEKRKYFIREIYSGLHFFYPGKFTTALLGARSLIERTSNITLGFNKLSQGVSNTSEAGGFEYSHPGRRLVSDRRLDDFSI